MPLTAHEVVDFRETYFSMERGADGSDYPTLWDSAAEGRTRAVCLTAEDGRVEIHTDPEIVGMYLDDEDIFEHDRAEIAASRR